MISLGAGIIVIVLLVVLYSKDKYTYNGVTSNNNLGTTSTWPTVVTGTNSLLLPQAVCSPQTLTTDSSGNLSITSSIPNGTIVMWTNPIIPVGWAMCDGTNGTPDLRSRYIVGANVSKSSLNSNLTSLNIGDIGGEEFHQLSVAEMPSHSHNKNNFQGGNSGPGDTPNASNYNYPNSSNTGPTGGDNPHNNLPPFYALVYIMKIN